MGVTIQDLLTGSQQQYQMQFLAGKNGWSNSISWVHLLEDTMIIENFWGKELAVTMGVGFQTEGKLLDLVSLLVKKHASGLIINVGKYIREIPQEILEYCNQNDFPLLTVPWEIFLADMIKDFSIRIYLQESADEQISGALIGAIENPENQSAYRKRLLPYFDVDGCFQIMLITCKDLDEMDTVERKKLSYRIAVYLEEITHNGSFFYYNSNFILALNAVTRDAAVQIAKGMLGRAKRRMPDIPLYVGMGSQVMDLSLLSISYQRAQAAVIYAHHTSQSLVLFDEMGLNRLIYTISDTLLLREMEEEKLKLLEQYDQKHGSNYLGTLERYLKSNCSIQAVSEQMFTHRNTVLYRMANIRKMLGTDLSTPQERMTYLIAFMIRNMHCM